MKTNRFSIIAVLAIIGLFCAGSSAIAQDRQNQIAGYTGHAAGTPTSEPPADLSANGVYHPTGNECRAMSEFSQKTGIVLKLGHPLENDQPLWQYTPEGARWTWAPKGMRFWVDMNDPNETPLFAGPLPEGLRTAADRDTGCCNAVSVTPPAPQAPPPSPPPTPVEVVPPPPPPPAQPPVWQIHKEYVTKAGDAIRPVPTFSFLVKSVDGSFSRSVQNDAQGLVEVTLAGPGCYTVEEGKSPISRFAGALPAGLQECFQSGEVKQKFIKNVQVVPPAKITMAPPVYYPEPAKVERSFPWKPVLVIGLIAGAIGGCAAAGCFGGGHQEAKPPYTVTRPASVSPGFTTSVTGIHFSFGHH